MTTRGRTFTPRPLMRLMNRSSRRQGTSDRDDLIVSLYASGVPVTEIAELTGVCVKTVRNVARRRGLPPRNPSKPRRDAAIVESYRLGKPVIEIAAEHQVSTSWVRHVAARCGLPARSGWQRRYPIDEGAFDHPTSIGWWLIGLLAADGSINAAEHRVSLCQSTKDADVLSAFYAYMGCPDRPLTHLRLSDAASKRQWARGPAAEARIFSKHVVRTLARHGIVPRKTASMELGDEAAKHPAVWLGLLDGDGSLGIYRNGREPRIVFTGARPLMRQCEQFWRATLGFVGPHPAAAHHRKGLWRFGLSNAKAVAGAQVLLASSPVSMKRKRALLLELAEWGDEPLLRTPGKQTMVAAERRPN